MITFPSRLVERYHVVKEHYGNEMRFSFIEKMRVSGGPASAG